MGGRDGEPSTCSCTQHPPAGLPVSSPGWTLPTSRPWRFCLLAFLDPHGPSCSSTPLQEGFVELLRAGLQGLRWDSPQMTRLLSLSRTT